ncbi:MAG: diguanylate cyclase with sensor [Acidobacteria bacterium]|nr:diguanylate cyclase with sensor [Acidobacteriota bacterium]
MATNKHVEKAERLLQKGKMEAALEEYLLAWKEEPSNDALVSLVGDLYLRLNRFDEGRKCLSYLFDKYAENNDVAKAVEAFRKVQRLGPVEPARLIRFAQLLEKVKPKEAVEYYHLALDGVVGQNSEMALQCLRGLATLEPSSVEVQARMAALALKLGKTDLATVSYQKVGMLRMSEGRYPEAIEALEEAFRLPGGAPTVRVDLARSCAKAGRFGRVISVLEDRRSPSDPPEVLDLLGEAYLAEKQFDKAEKVYQNLLENSPTAVGPLVTIAMECINRGSVPQGLRTLKGIEQQLTISGRQEALTLFAKQLSEFDHAHIPVLEYTAHLLDRLHQDTPLTKTLNRLFEIHFSAEDYSKAGEALEQLVAIDIYSSECADKLDRLQGKLDSGMWNELASRMGLAPKPGGEAEAFPKPAGEAPGSEPEAGQSAEGGANLRDLILQAEIFLQYNLKDKALERLENIARQFPHEDEKNEDVRALFERAGYKPPYEPSPAAPPPVSSAEPQDMRSYVSRVTEVSRNLARQGTVKGVLSSAVNDVGRHWQVSRCMVGLLAPNRPPSMALEYISPGIQPSDPMLIGKLLMGLQQIVVDQGSTLVVENVARAPALSSLQNFLKTLQVESLAAILLREENQPMGLLVLEQCGSPRAWKPNELGGLEALAEQVVLSVTNVRLRNLMRTLAVTDERSGLLHRDSYVSCLLSEAERMQTQQKPLTGALLQFSQGDQKSAGKQPLLPPEEFLQSVSGTIVAHLRQSDIAIRYGPLALVLILPGTSGKEAVTVVEKLRRLVTATDPTKAGPPRMTVFLGEAVQERGMENVDVVTELINRLDMAAESVPVAGDASTRLLGPSPFQQS